MVEVNLNAAEHRSKHLQHRPAHESSQKRIVGGGMYRKKRLVNDKRCTQGRNRQMKPREIITNNIIQETVQHKTGGKDSVKCDVM